MDDLMESIAAQLRGAPMAQLSNQLGADSRTTQNAVQAALPLLLGALAKNSADGGGAEALAGALDRDHDGSILDDLGGFLGAGPSSDGAAILGHVFRRGGHRKGDRVADGSNRSVASNACADRARVPRPPKAATGD